MGGWKSQEATQVEVDVYSVEQDVVRAWEDPDKVAESDGEGEVQVISGSIGLLPQEAYDKQLLPWVVALRRRIIRNLAWESEVLAAMQVRSLHLHVSTGH